MHRKQDSKLPTGSLPEIVDSFGLYFVTKIENIRKKIIDTCPAPTHNSHPPPSNLEPCLSKLSNFSLATDDEITKIILKSKNATCDLDPLPTDLLKKCLPTIVPLITKLVNISLSTGSVPSCFKYALVKPLIKKASLDPEIQKNFRPISNLPFHSKVLEKIVSKRLYDYMTDHNLHEIMQSAYKPNHSTESALIRIQNDILRELDKRHGMVLVLLDLSAAFDTIDHQILLKRLEDQLGICGTVLSWFASYLSDRSSAISINKQTSGPSTCHFGVPQGSVLGPVLFTIYTMPLSKIISSFGLNYHFYADDTQIYVTFNPKQSYSLDESLDKMEKCITAVKRWMSDNMLKLNDEKTEVLFIASPHFQKTIPSPSLLIGDTAVSRSKNARNIGVVFDDRLLMKEQISSICRSTHCHLRNIGSIRKYLTQDACVTLVHSLVSSRIDYCNALLSKLPDTSLNRLQRVLNTAARIVSLRPKHHHITPVLYSLHWLPIQQRIEFKVLLFVFKSVHQIAPSYLCELMIPYEPKRSLRSSEKLLLDYDTPASKYGERAFSIYGPTLWNLLPVDIRLTKTVDLFKNRIKTFLFKEAFPQDYD